MTLTSRKVSEEGRPEKAWRLTVGRFNSEGVSKSRVDAGVGSGIEGKEGSGMGSSCIRDGLSAMNKRMRPLQR